MKTGQWAVVGAAIASAAALTLASCGDDESNAAAAPPAVEPDPLRLEITAATVPDFATTARPTVTFRVLDGSGNPVDLEAELATSTTFPNMRASGARAPTFTLAMLDPNNDYVSYYSTTRAAANYTYVVDPEVVGTAAPFVPPVGTWDSGTGLVTVGAGVPATQVSSFGTGNALGPNFAKVGDRTYQFTFPAFPPGSTTAVDTAAGGPGAARARTHTVAGWAVRKPNAADNDIGFGSFNFVPAGGTAEKFETITDDGCNRCHGALTAHGTRRGTQFCITCHSPQTTDPETGRSVNFKVMIHKIHYGSDSPTVKQGIPYYIVGNSQSVHDWSDLSFPWHDHGVAHCTVCHTGEDADNWRSRPTLTVCTACHGNVSFASGSALPPCTGPNNVANCVHTGGPITVTNPNSTATCQGCHGVGAAQAVDHYHHGD